MALGDDEDKRKLIKFRLHKNKLQKAANFSRSGGMDRVKSACLWVDRRIVDDGRG